MLCQKFHKSIKPCCPWFPRSADLVINYWQGFFQSWSPISLGYIYMENRVKSWPASVWGGAGLWPVDWLMARSCFCNISPRHDRCFLHEAQWIDCLKKYISIFGCAWVHTLTGLTKGFILWWSIMFISHHSLNCSLTPQNGKHPVFNFKSVY